MRLSIDSHRSTLREQGSKFRLDAIVRRLQHFAARHDDNVERGGGLVVAKQLANEPLRAVSLDGGAHFSRGCYTQTRRSRLPFPREHGHEAARALETCFVDELEVGPLPNMLGGPEAGHLLLV